MLIQNWNNFLKQGSLDKIIASREMLPSGQCQFFDNEEIFKWSYDILRALKYLRNKYIVHRDVKPQYVTIFWFNFFILNKRRHSRTNHSTEYRDNGNGSKLIDWLLLLYRFCKRFRPCIKDTMNASYRPTLLTIPNNPDSFKNI